MEPCKYDATVGGMEKVLTGLVKEIYGNGQIGLSKSVPAMQRTLDVLVRETAEQRVAVSAVLKFIAETSGYENGCQKVKENQEKRMAAYRQKTAIIVTLLVGVFTIIAMTIINYS